MVAAARGHVAVVMLLLGGCTVNPDFPNPPCELALFCPTEGDCSCDRILIDMRFMPLYHVPRSRYPLLDRLLFPASLPPHFASSLSTLQDSEDGQSPNRIVQQSGPFYRVLPVVL